MEEDNKDKKGKYISDCASKKIKLTLAELLYIDDTITMAVNGVEFEGMMPIRVPMPSNCTIVTIDFIDKIGQAFLTAMRTGNDVPVKVSELELYILRELCFAKIEYFGKRVGLTLKRKVLTALYADRKKEENLLEQLLKDIDLGDTE